MLFCAVYLSLENTLKKRGRDRSTQLASDLMMACAPNTFSIFSNHSQGDRKTFFWVFFEL